jgi:hypothetical protein
VQEASGEVVLGSEDSSHLKSMEVAWKEDAELLRGRT